MGKWKKAVLKSEEVCYPKVHEALLLLPSLKSFVSHGSE